jgi:hypothetical protein
MRERPRAIRTSSERDGEDGRAHWLPTKQAASRHAARAFSPSSLRAARDVVAAAPHDSPRAATDQRALVNFRCAYPGGAAAWAITSRASVRA